MRALAVATALVAAVLLALVARAPEGARTAGTPAAHAAATVPSAPAHPAPAPVGVAARRARADLLATTSLRGTEVDGSISWSGAALLPDRELRRAFDYWLNLTGELSRDDIRALVAQWLAATAPADVAQRALDLFDRYLGLREAVARLDADEPLADRLARLHALRVEWLGREAAAAFFADEERDAMLALERRRIATDRALSAAERGERIAALDAALGGPERVAREADAEPWLAEAQTRELDAGGADAATRAQERTALFGQEAALRLAELDAERADFERRVGEYVRARDLLVATTPATAQQAAIDALRASRFPPHEARRVASLEAVGALPGG